MVLQDKIVKFQYLILNWNLHLNFYQNFDIFYWFILLNLKLAHFISIDLNYRQSNHFKLKIKFIGNRK